MSSALRNRSYHLSQAVIRASHRCEHSVVGVLAPPARVTTANTVALSRRYASATDHEIRLQGRASLDSRRGQLQAYRTHLGHRCTAKIQTRQSSATSTTATPRPSTASPAPADSTSPDSATQSLSDGLNDSPFTVDETGQQVDWARSFHGLSAQPFAKEAADVLLKPIPLEDIEIKPDGILYLPEIKYRRILNRAFGPGGWGLAPRGETIVTDKSVTREYALVAHGRLVSVARGEQDYFAPEGIPTAAEGCKSNAMTRCCKDLGVASELWDPRFVRKFTAEHVKEVFVEHAVTKKRRKIWLRKDDVVRYPFKETKGFGTYG
ncbi:MAG: hypothetical protein M1816_000948 [Peltula sp. TS41687]|nr:MAG: hypothetical protein M1816_000948 [Peltula sp. TS41687]